MAEDLISEYIDRNGIRGDTDYILASLREVYSEFKKLEGIRIDLKGLNGLAGLSPVLNQAKAGADSLALATQAVTDRIAAMNGSSKEFTQVLLAQTKAQKEAAQTALIEAKAANEAAKAKAAETKSTHDSTRAKAADQKLLDQAVDDYFQLGRAYTEAALKAKNYVLRLGEGHPIAVQAIKDANDLGNILKKLDASVGQNQRNVGNYKSAFDGLGFSFTQVARELPTLSQSFELFARAIGNNLPMVSDEIGRAKKEIAALKAEGKDTPSLFQRITKSIFSFQVLLSVGITLFTVYAKQISTFVSNLFRSSGAVNQLRRQQELLNEVQKEVAKSAGTEIAQLQVLYKVATNLNVPIKERRKAVDELQKQYPDYFKNLKDEIILQGQAAAAYDKTKAAILETAKTRAIENKLAALANEELDLQQKKEELLRKQEKNRLDKLKADASTLDPEGRGLEQFNAIARGSELTKALSDTNSDLANIAKDREFLLNQITNAGITKPGGGGTKAIKNNIDEINKLLAEARRQAFENRKKQIEDEIKAGEEIAANDKLTQAKRIEGANIAFDASSKLLRLQRAFELSELEIQTQESLAAIERKGKEEKLSRQKIEEEKLAVLALNYQKQRGIEIQFNSDTLDLYRDYRKKRMDIADFFGKKELEAEKKLQSDLAKGIEEAYKRFAKAEEERTKKQKEEADKRLKAEEDLAKRRFELERQLSTELQNLAFTVLTANIERQKNAIQEQIDLLNERKQKEIEVANQTIANAQDRAAAITTIEARAAAQKEQLEKKQRDLDIKKAQFDKAQAIVRIVQETAIGIIKATAALQPQLIPLIVAIGAAQLATVIAQPIPRYKHGKNVNDDYEGPAIVGDGGRKEAIIREDGSLEITADKPQLTYVKSRDVVLPDVNQLVNYVLAGNMGGSLIAKKSVPDENLMQKAVERMEKNIVNAIRSQPKLNLSSNEAGLAAMWKYGANQTKYINEQTNW